MEVMPVIKPTTQEDYLKLKFEVSLGYYVPGQPRQQRKSLFQEHRKQTNLLQNITYRPSMLTYTYNLIYSKEEAEEAKINPGNLEKERNSFAKAFST